MTEKKFKYWAFISYSREDNREIRPTIPGGRHVTWGAWLQNALENYAVPPDLVGTFNRYGELIPARLHPVFRDETDLGSSGRISDSINEEADESRCLVVICSPNSAKSGYVNEEICHFKKLGRGNRILPIIIRGEPGASLGAKVSVPANEECFAPAMLHPVGLDGKVDESRADDPPLGADLRWGDLKQEILADNWKDATATIEHAKLHLLSGILGVDLDDLIRRDKVRQLAEARAKARRQRNLTIGFASLSLLAMAAAWFAWKQMNQAKARLADSWVSQADALLQTRRAGEARDLYVKAWDTYEQIDRSPVRARISLWNSQRLSPSPLEVFSDHRGDAVNHVEFCQDGCSALAAHNASLHIFGDPDGSEETITRWNFLTGERMRGYHGHSSSVTSLSVSKTTSRFLSAGADGTIRLWDLDGGEEIRSFEPRVGYLSAVSFCGPEGKEAVSAGFDGVVRLWDVETGMQLAELGKHFEMDPDAEGVENVSSARNIAVTPDGLTAISSGDDGQVRFWDLASRKEFKKVGELPDTSTGSENLILALAISPDGKSALSGGSDQSLTLWDVGKRERKKTFAFHSEDTFINSLSFSPDGKKALSGASDGVVYLWDIEAGRVIRTFSGHVNVPVESVAFSADGNLALSGGGNHVMNVWVLDNLADTTLAGHSLPINDLKYSPDSRMVVSGGEDWVAKIWDVATGKQLGVSPQKPRIVHDRINSVEFDGKDVLMTSMFSVKYWNPLAIKDVPRDTASFWEAERICADDLVASPDRRSFFLCSRNEIGRWDIDDNTYSSVVDDKRENLDLKGMGIEAFAIAFKGGRPFVLTAFSNGTLELWDARRPNKRIRGFDGPAKDISSIALSPDGRFAVSGDSDGIIRWWDVGSGKPIDRSLSGHRGAGITPIVSSVCYSPDGELAVSTAGDMKVWQSDSGSEVVSLNPPHNMPDHVVFAPDGTSFSSSEGGSARIWKIGRAYQYRTFDQNIKTAMMSCAQDPDNAVAAAALGELFAFRGAWTWAIDQLERARKGGARISPLTLARCYWMRGKFGDLSRAEIEFQNALPIALDDSERYYLELCLHAVRSTAK
jgi:WD40 repeat protein